MTSHFVMWRTFGETSDVSSALRLLEMLEFRIIGVELVHRDHSAKLSTSSSEKA